MRVLLWRLASSFVAALVGLGTVVFAVPAHAMNAHALASTVRRPSAPVASTYVALGDSFTSGPAIPTQLSPNTVPSAPSACGRSSKNYPSLVARELGLHLTDVSCLSAKTEDVTKSEGPGIPAQLSALNQSTSLITLGIGGNDLGYTTIAANCAALTPWGPTRVGKTCEAHYTDNGVDQLARTIHDLGSKVRTILNDIRVRAHNARVFVIGYPDVVPPSGPGCWPDLPFTRSDLSYLRGVEANLNSMLSTVARAAGDVYVNMAGPSAAHSACTDRNTRWVSPILPFPGSYPLHPDSTGMVGMARVLEAAMTGDRNGR
ncbi:MAG: SGNH/GDSL hydrolase family protein [Acidimicrobiales bacterium]